MCIKVIEHIHSGQESVLADKHILVLEASSKPPKKLSSEDPYGMRVVNVNMGSVELLMSKSYVLPFQLDHVVV